MNQQTLDRIQPYVDEYCRAKKSYDRFNGVHVYHFEVGKFKEKTILEDIMNSCEKSIMQILIEEHESNPINELK